jgi:hypothetical protein
VDDSGLVGVIVAIVAVLAAATAGTAGYLYATDAILKADVKGTLCLGPLQPDDDNTISVKTRLLGLDHDVTGVPDQECQLVDQGNYVEYHVRSRHTTLYERQGGKCIYDTLTGVLCQAAQQAP